MHGHGKPDEGAQSSTGTTEAATNLKIALKLQNLLEQSGTIVILTRSDENAIYDIEAKTLKQKKISDIHNRVKIGNESSADLFVSIHLNKIPQQQYDGWQTFYKQGSEEGKKLAISIQNNLNEAIQKENNRVAKTIENIYIIKHVEIPITIVECGFLSNPAEEKKLLEDDYQNRLDKLCVIIVSKDPEIRTKINAILYEAIYLPSFPIVPLKFLAFSPFPICPIGPPILGRFFLSILLIC